MSRQGLVPIVIIVAVAIAVALGGYVVLRRQAAPPAFEPGSASTEIEPAATTTSTTDVSGWQTYRNEEYGFEVKYPPEFTQDRIENWPERVEGVRCRQDVYFGPIEEGRFTFALCVDSYIFRSLKQYATSYWARDPSPSEYVDVIETLNKYAGGSFQALNVNGIVVVKRSGHSDYHQETFFADLPRGGLLEIRFNDSANDVAQMQDVAGKVLSTFRFIPSIELEAGEE